MGNVNSMSVYKKDGYLQFLYFFTTVLIVHTALCSHAQKEGNGLTFKALPLLSSVSETQIRE